jgi:hypothetical protein
VSRLVLRLKPAAVVLYAGDNDLAQGGALPDQAFASFRDLYRALRGYSGADANCLYLRQTVAGLGSATSTTSFASTRWCRRSGMSFTWTKEVAASALPFLIGQSRLWSGTAVVFLAFKRSPSQLAFNRRPFRGERSEPSPTDWNTSSGTLAVCFGLWRASPNHFDVIYFFDTRLVEEVCRIVGRSMPLDRQFRGDRRLALRFRITAEVSGVRRQSNRKPAFRCHFECRSLALADRQSCGAHNAQPATATVYF